MIDSILRALIVDDDATARERLGFQEHDIAPLIAAKLLNPLGKPAPNAPKYFASVDIQAAAQDREWLSQATRALARYWQGKNARKKSDGNRLTAFVAAA